MHPPGEAQAQEPLGAGASGRKKEWPKDQRQAVDWREKGD